MGNDPRNIFKSQIFWIGEEDKNKKELWDWYSYVCRTPQLPGHIILANLPEGDILNAPKGFEEALNLNIDFLLEWSQVFKAKDCLPVFIRMNIQKQQFRIHVLPISNKEIGEATTSLKSRIPESQGEGGLIYYLGPREDKADRLQVEFNKIKKDPKATEALMRELSITNVVDQLRNIVSLKGYRCML